MEGEMQPLARVRADMVELLLELAPHEGRRPILRRCNTSSRHDCIRRVS